GGWRGTGGHAGARASLSSPSGSTAARERLDGIWGDHGGRHQGNRRFRMLCGPDQGRERTMAPLLHTDDPAVLKPIIGVPYANGGRLTAPQRRLNARI